MRSLPRPLKDFLDGLVAAHAAEVARLCASAEGADGPDGADAPTQPPPASAPELDSFLTVSAAAAPAPRAHVQ